MLNGIFTGGQLYIKSSQTDHSETKKKVDTNERNVFCLQIPYAAEQNNLLYLRNIIKAESKEK
jgi:hypothetical protein